MLFLGTFLWRLVGGRRLDSGGRSAKIAIALNAAAKHTESFENEQIVSFLSHIVADVSFRLAFGEKFRRNVHGRTEHGLTIPNRIQTAEYKQIVIRVCPKTLNRCWIIYHYCVRRRQTNRDITMLVIVYRL